MWECRLVEPECLILKIQRKPHRALFAVRQGSALVGVETEVRLAAIVEGKRTGILVSHLIVERTPFFIVCPETSATILLKCKESHIVTRFKAHFTVDKIAEAGLIIGRDLGNTGVALLLQQLYVGRKVLCNKPYSGTKVIADYGREHVETGALIVYTSADSVFQIAAHESVVPVEELYRYCEIARDILVGDHAVGRVIARPFEGEHPYTRTSRRHDFSLVPPKMTMLDYIADSGMDVIGIGKIYDIFAGKSVLHFNRIIGNEPDMNETTRQQRVDFRGLCFTNLVDFDMSFGHRRDAVGYANALNEFDRWLGGFMENMQADDVLIITADHGCDPCHSGTDHTREYVPLLVYSPSLKVENLGTLDGFNNVAELVCKYLGVKYPI